MTPLIAVIHTPPLPAIRIPQKRSHYTDDEKDFIERLERGRGHVAGFIRTSLYKRLSSCGLSFVLSLKRIVAGNEPYAYAVTNNLEIPVGTLLENMLISDNDEDIDVEGTADTAAMYHHLRAKAPASIEWVASRLFSNTLIAALERDNEDLRGLPTLFENGLRVGTPR